LIVASGNGAFPLSGVQRPSGDLRRLFADRRRDPGWTINRLAGNGAGGNSKGGPMSDATDRETTLVDWYLATYRSRTPARSVLDCSGQRVTQTEIREKMIDLGYGSNVVDSTRVWFDIYNRRSLRRKCNAMRKAAGEGPVAR